MGLELNQPTIYFLWFDEIILMVSFSFFFSFEYFELYSFLEKAAIVVEDDFERDVTGGSVPNPWKLCSLTRVEEVKMMVRLLPIWATTIIFWTAYAQMITFSVEQASTMDRNIGSFQIPAGSLTVFFVAAILLTLAVNDRIIMPLWKKLNGKPGTKHMTPNMFISY